MLTIDVTGDTHPKTFKLVTDDADGELATLDEMFKEMGADDWAAWMDAHTAGEFAEGVEFPAGEIGELADVLEHDWPNAWATIETQRREYAAQLEGDAD